MNYKAVHVMIKKSKEKEHFAELFIHSFISIHSVVGSLVHLFN